MPLAADCWKSSLPASHRLAGKLTPLIQTRAFTVLGVLFLALALLLALPLASAFPAGMAGTADVLWRKTQRFPFAQEPFFSH